MKTLKLEIVTPSGVIFDKEIAQVTLPGEDGEFGVLPGHASLLSLLKVGTIEITHTNADKDIVAIDWGHAKIGEDKISILAHGAVHIAGSSDGRLKDAIKKAKDLVSSISSDNASLANTISKIEKIG